MLWYSFDEFILLKISNFIKFLSLYCTKKYKRTFKFCCPSSVFYCWLRWCFKSQRSLFSVVTFSFRRLKCAIFRWPGQCIGLWSVSEMISIDKPKLGYDRARLVFLTLKIPEGGQMAPPLRILAMVHLWRKKCGIWNVCKFSL